MKNQTTQSPKECAGGNGALVSELNTADLQDSLEIFPSEMGAMCVMECPAQSVSEEQLFTVELLLPDSKNTFSV